MNADILLSLLKNLLYIRLVEEKICELYPEQEMRCPVHLCIGQEAACAGVCENLTKEDVVFSNHRCHGHYLAKGGDLNKFFAEIYGKSTGCSKGRGGSMHLIDLDVNFMGSTPIVGGTIPLALGAGLTFSMQKNKKIAVGFFGDAATEEGVFHESLNFAKLKKLPVLFVCENNLYSVHTPLSERQPSRRIKNIAKAHGLDCYEADGNDVLDVYEKSKKAIDKIKNKKGPVFIEILTYRFKEHCGPNEDTGLGYRTRDEVLEWKTKDCIKILKQKLFATGLIKEEQILEIERQIKQKIEQAVNFAKSSDFPNINELEQYVYSD